MMDYTTLARVKSEANMLETDAARDALLSTLITTASRAIDRYCTSTAGPASDNYFQTATITDEQLIGFLTNTGSLFFYLHKPSVSAVTSLSWRLDPRESWQDVDPALIWADGSPIMTSYAGLNLRPAKVFGKVTYTGGLGATTADLPGDIVEAATVWTIRYFREAQTGLTDQIGVADLGILLYTKAIPERVRAMLMPYVRLQPWRPL